MSVRAYKVIKMELEDAPSFNVWNDEEIREALVGDQLTDESGLVTVEHEKVVQLIKDIAEDPSIIEAERLQETRAMLEKIENDTKADGYARYYCF
jgi:hypothetical protein